MTLSYPEGMINMPEQDWPAPAPGERSSCLAFIVGVIAFVGFMLVECSAFGSYLLR